MMQKIRGKMCRLNNNQGFTLVEMALVLIIIGIIIGAIVKGKDLVRSAEIKRVYSKYLNEWNLAYLNFYDRTGKILGDSWDSTAAVPAAGQDGQADTAAGSNSAVPTDAGRDDLVTGDGAANPVYRGLDTVGLDKPVTNVPGRPWQYRFVDSSGGAHLLDVAFEWDGVNNYNYMMINNVPVELALALDTMVDGTTDGTAGDFLFGTGVAWPATPSTECDDVRWRMKF